MSLTLLHAAPNENFLTSWSTNPLLIAGISTSAVLYGVAYREVQEHGRSSARPKRAAAFYGGLAAITLSLLGPLDTWNDELFLIHMLQHLVLMIVAAPLLLLGRPLQLALQAAPRRYSSAVVGAIFTKRSLRRVATILTHPLTVFLMFNTNLALWHLPSFYNLALENDLVHEIEHVAFLGTALLFWWVIIDPVPRHHRASIHWRFGMCFGTCMFGGLVAAALTVANRVLYPHYLSAEQPWGLTPLMDQQIGGGIMWVSGGLYFVLMFVMLYKMVNSEVSDHDATQQNSPRPTQSEV